MKIAAKFQKPLAAARADIAAGIAAVTRASSNLEKMIADEEVLNAHIDRLTTDADYSNSKAVTDLTESQTKIGLLRQQIERARNLADPQLAALKEKLVSLRDIIQPAMQGELAALQWQIAETLLPLHGVWANAHWHAGTVPKMASFVSFYLHRSFGGRVDVMAEARELLGILDALLKGEHAWKFYVESAPDEQAA